VTDPEPPDAADARNPAALSIDAIRGGSHRQLIDAQLAEERANKSGLEQRALGVITTSGILATLVFGVAAFATQGQRLTLHPPDQALLASALACFVAAAVAALLAVLPRKYEEAGVDRLKGRVSRDEWFQTDVVEAYRLDAKVGVDIIAASRTANYSKAKCLYTAVILDVLAVACVASAVGLVLYGA
jgi:hypothetical protein